MESGNPINHQPDKLDSNDRQVLEAPEKYTPSPEEIALGDYGYADEDDDRQLGWTGEQERQRQHDCASFGRHAINSVPVSQPEQKTNGLCEISGSYSIPDEETERQIDRLADNGTMNYDTARRRVMGNLAISSGDPIFSSRDMSFEDYKRSFMTRERARDVVAEMSKAWGKSYEETARIMHLDDIVK